MKITELQMAIIALIVIGLIYLYNNPTIVYKNKPVYYPVYETEYVPINRGFRQYPRGRMPRHHRRHPGHNIKPNPDRPIKPVPGFIPGVPNPNP